MTDKKHCFKDNCP